MPTRSSTRPSTRPPTRPPSPSRDVGAIDDLSSALHEALQPLQETEHGKHEKFPPTLEIAVNQELLALKGTGPDVEPALLAGSVKLHLSEPMSIREITLSFRGKARVPPPTGEPLSLSASGLTYIVCDHEWSFLEGTKGHSHTLKAGHHVFPFQMQIGGSLPSSIYTSALGSASVSYKLRAVAVRPGLAHNLQAQAPVSVVRSFTPEALEYQQTLEIENTWPEKLMYSIMVPHKAYAIGDRLTALMKFEPIAKGVKVMSIVTTLNETVKITSRAGQAQEITRIVMTTKHEIAGGKAVCVEEFANRRPLHGPVTPHAHAHRTGSTPGTPSTSPTASTSYFPPVASSSSAPEPLPSDITLPEDLEPSETEVVTTMALPLSAHAGITPTHALEPLVVTHRVRWSILIANPDGHTSELRCSLPLHILDGRLLREARAATLVTRNLLLGGESVFAEERDAEVDRVGGVGCGVVSFVYIL